MPRRHNHKGRSTTERFVALPYWMLQSPAWRRLSPVARSVLIELAAVYNGNNNGRLALSARDAAKRVRCSKNTAARAFVELIQKGFVDLCSCGHFDRKTPHAAEYRLTLHSCDRTGERAARRFMSWRPDEPKSVAGPTRGTAGVTTGTVTSTTKENCRELSLSRDRKGSLESSSGVTTGTHIIYQMGSGVEVVRDSVNGADEQLVRRVRHAS
jgi:Helix-turn-helix domain